MNAVKTKIRNRMKTSLLTSLLRKRLYFFEMRICCNNFEPTPSMLKKFNYVQLYGSDKSNDSDDLTPDGMEILDILNNFQYIVPSSE